MVPVELYIMAELRTAAGGTAQHFTPSLFVELPAAPHIGDELMVFHRGQRLRQKASTKITSCFFAVVRKRTWQFSNSRGWYLCIQLGFGDHVRHIDPDPYTTSQAAIEECTAFGWGVKPDTWWLTPRTPVTKGTDEAVEEDNQ